MICVASVVLAPTLVVRLLAPRLIWPPVPASAPTDWPTDGVRHVEQPAIHRQRAAGRQHAADRVQEQRAGVDRRAAAVGHRRLEVQDAVADLGQTAGAGDDARGDHVVAVGVDRAAAAVERDGVGEAERAQRLQRAAVEAERAAAQARDVGRRQDALVDREAAAERVVAGERQVPTPCLVTPPVPLRSPA